MACWSVWILLVVVIVVGDDTWLDCRMDLRIAGSIVHVVSAVAVVVESILLLRLQSRDCLLLVSSRLRDGKD